MYVDRINLLEESEKLAAQKGKAYLKEWKAHYQKARATMGIYQSIERAWKMMNAPTTRI